MHKRTLVLLLFFLAASQPNAEAEIYITPTADANALANAFIATGAGGITIRGSSIVGGYGGFDGTKSSHGFYSVTPGKNYGMTKNGIVLSTGSVVDYDSYRDDGSLALFPPISGAGGVVGYADRSKGTDFARTATPAQNALLFPITGRNSHKDVATLDLMFDVGPTTREITFDLVFGSEEFPEYVNNLYADGFGIFLNGQNIAFSNSDPINVDHPAMASVPATELDGVIAPRGSPVLNISGKVTPGSTGNTLSFLLADTTDAIYDSTIYISALSTTTDLSVYTLRNFDVISPPDMKVNDFEITLKGVDNPEVPTPPDGEPGVTYYAHVGSVYPTPGKYHRLPSGWTPETITSSRGDTVIRWGPGDQIMGQKLHFGVSLTPEGEAALEGLCMTWTKDGVPVYEGADPNLPLTITTSKPRPGEASVQIVNQVCPDQVVIGPPRWIGQVHVSVLPHGVGLDNLLADDPLMLEAQPVTAEAVLLGGGEIMTLQDLDAMTPIGNGSSLVVWYDVYEDDSGAMGRQIGTSFTAFNYVATPIPEPGALLLALVVLPACWVVRRVPQARRPCASESQGLRNTTRWRGAAEAPGPAGMASPRQRGFR